MIGSRRIRGKGAGHAARLCEIRYAYKIVAGKPEMKSTSRSRRRWDGNTRTDFGETEWECVHWIHQTQGRVQWHVLVNTMMNPGHHKRGGIY